MTTKCNMVSGQAPGTEKGHGWKTDEITVKSLQYHASMDFFFSSDDYIMVM